MVLGIFATGLPGFGVQPGELLVLGSLVDRVDPVALAALELLAAHDLEPSRRPPPQQLRHDDLIAAWDKLKEFGVPFMTAPPETYYEMLPERLPDHGQPVDELKARGILLDGTTEGGQPRLLLQIFAEAQVGPVFFEFIQRKGDEGFGEGNFKALFESMERDQVRRGVLNVEDAKTVSEPAE